MKTREKLLNGALAVLIITVIAIAVIKYGPMPRSEIGDTPTAVSEDMQRRRAVSSAKDRDDVSLDMLGLIGRKSGNGHVSVTAATYIGSLEGVYVARGYRQFSQLRKLQSGSAGLYFRNKINEWHMILAIGKDANPAEDHKAPEIQSFLTIAKEQSDGTDWSSFVLPKLDAEKVASRNDLFGSDPAGIPRPEQARRLIGFSEDVAGSGSLTVYSSDLSPDDLSRWYRMAMRGGWKSDDGTSVEARKGLLMFSQDARKCLIWICAGEPSGSFAVISLHDQ